MSADTFALRAIAAILCMGVLTMILLIALAYRVTKPRKS